MCQLAPGTSIDALTPACQSNSAFRCFVWVLGRFREDGLAFLEPRDERIVGTVSTKPFKLAGPSNVFVRCMCGTCGSVCRSQIIDQLYGARFRRLRASVHDIEVCYRTNLILMLKLRVVCAIGLRWAVTRS